MVDFSSISPHLYVKISPKAKRLALRLDARARRVNLVVPKRASLYKAYEFAILNRAWIESKIDNLPRPLPFEDGMIIPLMGRNYTLRIIRGENKLTTLHLTDSTLDVITQRDDFSPRLLRFIKTLAATEMKKIAQTKAEQLGRPITKFTVRDMKSRWGSCSIDGKMSLSWRLVFAPIEAVDYVISHEAAHLIHPNHGGKFWELCESLSMDFKTGHGWMRKSSSQLGQYGETA